MDVSFANTNQLLELAQSTTLPEHITSQLQINQLQKAALLELNTQFRKNDYTLLIYYLEQFLAINSDINWNVHSQFHIDSFEFVKTILKDTDSESKARIRNHFAIQLKDKVSKLSDLVLFIETLSLEDSVALKASNKNLLEYYCELNEEYDHDEEYVKNVYLKKIAAIEDYFTALKSNNKEQFFDIIPFIENEFRKRSSDNDFVGKKCYLSGLALSVITKDYYEQFDIELLFTSFNLTEFISNYNIIEFNLAIQFYKQLFTTVVKRKSLYKHLKKEMGNIVSEILKILSTSSDFSIIESYSKSYIFQILSKFSIVDGRLLESLFVAYEINLKNDSDYKYLLEFYSFLDPLFISKYYKQEIKMLFSYQSTSINIYNQIPIIRNICSNEDLWQFIVEPVLPICKSLPILEQLVLLEKFSQYEHCLRTLLKQETWILQTLFIDILDEELLLLKENTLNNLLLKNGEFVRETDPVFHQKLKANIFGNEAGDKFSLATMTK